MAGSTFGTLLSVTTWGESHGRGIGVVIDGCPAGLPLEENDIQIYLNRRKPGQSRFTTRGRRTTWWRSGPASLKERRPEPPSP